LEQGLAEAEFSEGARLRELKLIQNAFKVGGIARSNGSRKGSFQLPIMLNGGISGLNMYVVNEAALESGGARVYMTLKTKGLGTVQAYFTSGDMVGVSFSTERPEAARFLRGNEDALRRALAEAGFKPGDINFIGGQNETRQGNPGYIIGNHKIH